MDGPWEKIRSIRPPSNDNLGPSSELVHEMDGLSQNFGPLSTWTDGRVDGPQTGVFVRGGLFPASFDIAQ